MDEPKKMGRPPFCPTDAEREAVTRMAAVGIPHEQIALVVGDNGINVDTLKKHFKRELETAYVEANTKVGQSMFQRAIDGDVGAQKWWTACRMGWKDASRVEVSGPDKGPVRTEWTYTIIDPKSEHQS